MIAVVVMSTQVETWANAHDFTKQHEKKNVEEYTLGPFLYLTHIRILIAQIILYELVCITNYNGNFIRFDAI